MEHLIALADSRVAAVIYHGAVWALIAIVATTIGSLVAIYMIEGLQDAARSFKAWRKQIRKGVLA